MSQSKEPNQGLSIDIGDELSKNITIHKNVKQEIIISTADKIKLVLISTREILNSQRDWWTPFGLLISFIATLATAEFNDALGLKKEFWHAIFVLLTIGSSVWLLISLYKLYKNWGKNDLNKIIEQIQLKETNIETSTSEVKESSQIVFTNKIEILSATYIWSSGKLDVTQKIKNLVESGVYIIMVDPSTFGIPHPAHKIQNTLKIHCKINGQEKAFEGVDGKRIKIE